VRARSPDQQIAEDVRAFTATTLSFSLMAINSAFTILSFSGVLWSISPLLFVISVVYAAVDSYLTIKLARPLVKLNSDQLDREASFRLWPHQYSRQCRKYYASTRRRARDRTA
jgi:vitamin B12/bleomycin/antimicrobial peptide transport system ATP-binding/permease protein